MNATAARVQRPRFAVDAVIVNFNGGPTLSKAVQSVRASGASRVIVVDNASRDDSLNDLAAKDPEVEVIRNSTNRGYGAAANRGVAACHAPYVVILNPDVDVAEEVLSVLSSVLDRETDVGAVGPRIVDPSGAPYPSARTFPNFGVGAAHALVGMFWPHNRWSVRYRNERGAAVSRDVDWVSGACIAVRKLAFESIGGFDEGYFMYVEDLDLCWRLGRAGWRVRFEPLAVATHAQGLSTARRPYRMLAAHHLSAWRFANKSMTGRKRPLLAFVAVGLTVRAAVSLAKQAIDDARRDH